MALPREQINGIGPYIAGLLMLVANKPFGELCRQWNIKVFNRDYGILSVRVPIVVIGTLVLILGISLYFF